MKRRRVKRIHRLVVETLLASQTMNRHFLSACVALLVVSGQPSWAAERSLSRISPTDGQGRLRLGLRDWMTLDARAASPPSLWYISEGVIKQTENTIVNDKKAMKADPTLEREGTMFVYQRGKEFADGELSFDVYATDDDGIGVAFRWSSPSKYYLWYMDAQRRYRTLARKDSIEYRALEANRRGFDMRRWYAVKIVMVGPRIAVYVDGELEFDTVDSTHEKGTVAMFCWGNSGALFREVSFVPKEPEPGAAEKTDQGSGAK